MDPSPAKHFRSTAALGAALKRGDVYDWLVTKGYFPESYVLPPCFVVLSHPPFKKVYCKVTKNKFHPKRTECLRVHFPKTDVTDRTFSVMHPEIHSDIARTIARNWKTLLRRIFHKDNKVCSYSFPIPLDSRKKGSVATLRSGRMIYEWIAMAENDLAANSYRFNYLVKTDVKNFYPSIYTHSIPWAIHGKKRIRKKQNRYDFSFFGNRLDKLFQNANDGCTDGVPIGPAVSDLIAEVVLSGVDRLLSKMIETEIKEEVLVVRFKDDYRILAKTEQDGRSVIKALQAALDEYHLELNAEKTQFHKLPNGLFREWKSQYYSANPRPKSFYDFERFKEVCLSVVKIDGNNPDTGVIDSFLAGLVTKKYKLRLKLDSRSLPKIISLLLMLSRRRTKAFPKVPALIEAVLHSPFGRTHAREIADYLRELLQQLSKREAENRYLIIWICYFLRANGFKVKFKGKGRVADPIVRATFTSRFNTFRASGDFKLFQGVRAAAKRVSMLEHLDVFKPQ